MKRFSDKAVAKNYAATLPLDELSLFPNLEDELGLHNATTQQIYKLIGEGNAKLLDVSEKGILLLGNSSAGKSTLAHVLVGRQIQAIMNNENGELLIDAMHPLEDIIIGHRSASETKIPNKCLVADTVIWDCPGFNDTEIVQEIANSFYIQRLFATTKQIKFVLVVLEGDITTNNGDTFIARIASFIKSFSSIANIKGSISLIVNQVASHKNTQHIKSSIEAVLRDNIKINKEQRGLITKLINSSLHILHKPTQEGPINPIDLLTKIDSTEYIPSSIDLSSLSISPDAIELSNKLLASAGNSFNNILKTMLQAIANPNQALSLSANNIFFKEHSLLKDLIPEAMHYKASIATRGHLLELDLLSRLQAIFTLQPHSLEEIVELFQEAMQVFTKYVPENNFALANKIQDYAYALMQQAEYLKFFTNICNIALPNNDKLVTLVNICHTKLSENLEYQLNTLAIDKHQSLEYYLKAIEYLDKYDSKACLNIKAKAYNCYAKILEQQEPNQAIDCYIQAIQANRKNADTYAKLGNLFFSQAKYAKAIACYKVINDEYKINLCFKAWLKKEPNNRLEIMLQQAEHLADIGLLAKASKYYQYVAGSSQDEKVKAYALRKIGSILDNISQRQDFIVKANTYDFYNYTLVNEVFVQHISNELPLAALANARQAETVRLEEIAAVKKQAKQIAATRRLELIPEINTKELTEFLNLAKEDEQQARQILNASPGLKQLLGQDSSPKQAKSILKAFYPSYKAALAKQAMEVNLDILCQATLTGHNSGVYSLQALAPNKLASGSRDNTIKIWDLTTNTCLATLAGHRNYVYSLQALSDNKLASGSRDNTIKIWDLTTNTCLATLAWHRNYVYSLQALSDNKLASASSIDRTIKIWDLTTNTCQATLTGHGSGVYSLQALSDNKLASGSRDNIIKIWDLTTNTCQATLTGHGSGVYSLQALSDNKLASGSHDNTIKIWDLTTNTCQATLAGHNSSVYSLQALAPNKLASGSHDNTIKIWDLTTNTCQATLARHSSGVYSLQALAPNKLASGSHDNTIKIWDLAALKLEDLNNLDIAAGSCKIM